MLECVPNVSEGRDEACLRELARAAGAPLLDVHADPDHHRSVFTLASDNSAELEAATRTFARAVAASVSIHAHRGEHPRFGALDVVPFASLEEADDGPRLAVNAARAFATWWADAFDVPVFFYGDADAEGRALPEVRRHAFRGLDPDLGPHAPHPRLGATAVGARRPLVALNCVLASDDVALARRIARGVRERDGGLPGVRALGVMLPSRRRVQVSMNLVDLRQTGIESACNRVCELAGWAGIHVEAVELVGLAPRTALDQSSREFLMWSGIDANATIESRLRR